jgi:hypothetical protein
MKRILICISVLLLGTGALAETKVIEDTVQNRSLEAKRYLAVMPPREMLIDMVTKMAGQLPEEQKKSFISLMTKHVDVEKLTSIIHDSMVRHFTAAELHALADFYESSVGRSAMNKFGQYMADAMPHVHTLMEDALKRAMAETEVK